MEVFAALLGEKDALNIYAMSDYEGGAQPALRLMLDGSAGQTANVEKVHGMLTKAGNTPFTNFPPIDAEEIKNEVAKTGGKGETE